MSSSAQVNAKAPGKTLLMVVSIIFIVFGAFGAIFAAMGLAATGALIAVMGATATFEIIYNVVSLAVNLIMLIIGIIGIKKCKDPEKSGFFIGWGIAIAIISLVPMILSFFGVVSWISIVDVVLGVLYIAGGAMNKKALTA